MTGNAAAAVAMWNVSLNDGDWYWVFARNDKEAVRIVVKTHYHLMTTREFVKAFTPAIHRIADRCKMLVTDEDRGQHDWTAKRWCKGEKPGPFASNTYDQ